MRRCNRRCRAASYGVVADRTPRKIAQLRSKATRESVQAEVTTKLATRSMRSEVSWKTHRRTDGFVLLVAHAELVALYRQRDAVEKDFPAIKSVKCLKSIILVEVKVFDHDLKRNF